MVKLVVFFDPVCPWCYIGKARLDRALLARPDHPFSVEYHPFQLNLGMPRIGMDRREYLEAKFGGQQKAVDAYLPVHQIAEAEKIEMDLGAIARTPNTLDAHRLVHWATLEGRQLAAVDALFKAYFIAGKDIGDHEVLADIAAGIEMDRDVVLRLLSSEADLDDIRARDKDARDKGVTAVPTFVIANQHVVPGAQPTELWLNVIDEVTAAERGEGETRH